MKATIEFEEDLYRLLKSTAALRGKKLRELVTEGVKLILKNPEQNAGRRVKWPLIDSGRPGKLDIPDDIASRLEVEAEIERHAASLRQ